MKKCKYLDKEIISSLKYLSRDKRKKSVKLIIREKYTDIISLYIKTILLVEGKRLEIDGIEDICLQLEYSGEFFWRYY